MNSIESQFIEDHPNVKKIEISSCDVLNDGFPNLEHLDVFYDSVKFIRPLSNGDFFDKIDSIF